MMFVPNHVHVVCVIANILHFYLLAKIVKCVLLSNDEVFHDDQSDAVHVLALGSFGGGYNLE